MVSASVSQLIVGRGQYLFVFFLSGSTPLPSAPSMPGDDRQDPRSLSRSPCRKEGEGASNEELPRLRGKKSTIIYHHKQTVNKARNILHYNGKHLVHIITSPIINIQEIERTQRNRFSKK